VLAEMLPQLRFRTERLAAASDGLLLATDLADLLVERGLPFRRAHAVVGALVRHCLTTDIALRDLDAATLRRHSPLLTPALVRGLTPERSVARRRIAGGTAPRQVRRQLARAVREDAR
jgi:argininosuccinate lyase